MGLVVFLLVRPAAVSLPCVATLCGSMLCDPLRRLVAASAEPATGCFSDQLAGYCRGLRVPDAMTAVVSPADVSDTPAPLKFGKL